MDAWTRNGTEPPPSKYPTVAARELVPLAGVQFPKIPGVAFPTIMHLAYPSNYGPDFRTKGIATQEPPEIGQHPVDPAVAQVRAVEGEGHRGLQDQGLEQGGVGGQEIDVGRLTPLSHSSALSVTSLASVRGYPGHAAAVAVYTQSASRSSLFLLLLEGPNLGQALGVDHVGHRPERAGLGVGARRLLPAVRLDAALLA